MEHANFALIERFFAAYGSRDMAALRDVLSEHVTWIFPGQHPLAGTHRGIPAVLALFDAIGVVMSSSEPRVEKLVLGANDEYVVECQHIRTNRSDGPNLDQHMSVLWRFANGVIVSGEHLVGDQAQLDAFYRTLDRFRSI